MSKELKMAEVLVHLLSSAWLLKWQNAMLKKSGLKTMFKDWLIDWLDKKVCAYFSALSSKQTSNVFRVCD